MTMTRISKIAASLAIVPVVAFALPVFAESPGQLQGGANVYAVKNLTQKGSYGATATATTCDELQYSVDLHNTEFGKLTGIVVKATLPSASATTNVSAMTATTAAGGTTGTSGSVTVKLDSAQTIRYEAGSTQLFDSKGTLIKTLPDGITTEGVNVGDLNGSTFEFVNFKAKVNCPTPPKEECKPGVPKGDKKCETTPPATTTTTPSTPSTPAVKGATTTTPTELPHTGAGNVAFIAMGAAAVAAFAHRAFSFRRQSR
jgi:hypothetical protein